MPRENTCQGCQGSRRRPEVLEDLEYKEKFIKKMIDTETEDQKTENAEMIDDDETYIAESESDERELVPSDSVQRRERQARLGTLPTFREAVDAHETIMGFAKYVFPSPSFVFTINMINVGNPQTISTPNPRRRACERNTLPIWTSRNAQWFINLLVRICIEPRF